MPEGKQMPRILGVHHDPQTMKYMRAFVNRLPPRSKIGLEYDAEQFASMQPEWKPFIKGSEDMQVFSRLADYAREKGHTIVWLERPRAWLPPKRAVEWVKLVSAEARAIAMPNNAKAQAIYLKQKQAFRALGIALAPWRSTIMARIMQRHDWKPTDIAIMGGLHADHVGAIIGKEPEHIMFGNRSAYEHVIREGHAQQAIEHASLQARRETAKKMKRSSLKKMIDARAKRKR